MAGGLTSLEAAQAAILALARPAPALDVALAEARGWLAEPLVARRTQPWADLSAMDGYALGDGSGPWRIVRAIPAEARNPGTLGRGEAARILTGAPIPGGTDRILVQEDATTSDGLLTATQPASPGRWIRRRGSDFSVGQLLIQAGTRVTPGVIALAAMAGHGSVAVHGTPRATVLATGSELVPPGSTAPGLPSSNSPMLAALLSAFASVADAGIVGDSLPATRAAIDAFEAAHAQPALLLITGGASVGDHDLVRPALEAAGWTIALHRVAMKPGKPLIVAHKAPHIALGLPGNPVSAYVTALLFAAPLLRRMAGCPDPLPRHAAAILASPVPPGGNRVEYLRGRRTGDGRVEPIGSQDSAALLNLARADLLLRVDIGAPAREAGDAIDVIALD